MERIAPSDRLREELAELIRGGAAPGTAELRGQVIRLGIQRVLQELLEGEQREFVGVGRYERAEARRGQRNGYEPAHLATGEGRIEVQAPQVRGSAEPFQSRLLGFLRGRTEVVERLVAEM